MTVNKDSEDYRQGFEDALKVTQKQMKELRAGIKNIKILVANLIESKGLSSEFKDYLRQEREK